MNFNLQINFWDLNYWVAIANILFNPLFWNVVARWEYRTKKVSRAIGSAKVACFLFAVVISLLGILRDWNFRRAIVAQPRWQLLHENWILYSGYAIITVGCVLVFSSFVALGIFGTFLGDYFGILMNERVTSFPFNVMNDPMYWGTTMNFLGYAIIQASQVGILLSIVVGVTYRIAISFEGPFTTNIYNRAAEARKYV